MILKTYLRVFTDDMERSLTLLRKLSGRPAPDLRFAMPEFALDIAAIGDVLVVAGPPEAVAPFREAVGPLVVDDLDATQALLLAEGAEITRPITDVPTGRHLYARHADGSHVEYVQWTPELVARLIPNAAQQATAPRPHEGTS